MTSLAVLAWMSLTSAVLWAGGGGGVFQECAHGAVQVRVLAAVLLEAGQLESGRRSRGRRPLQALALLAFLVHLASAHPSLVRAAQSLFTRL